MAQSNDDQIQLYRAYLEDLGRIGGRHENLRTFYVSVISALFVFLSMAGKDSIFANVQGGVLVVVGVVGILVCLAWFEHMRSFGKLYRAKLQTLRLLEDAMTKNEPLKPFIIETGLLKSPPTPGDRTWRYRPITFVDIITPLASAVLFATLLLFKVGAS
jgi:hypothetical protein